MEQKITTAASFTEMLQKKDSEIKSLVSGIEYILGLRLMNASFTLEEAKRGIRIVFNEEKFCNSSTFCSSIEKVAKLY